VTTSVTLRALSILVAALLASCAAPMREIPPAPGAVYPDRNASCERLVRERALRSERLIFLGLRQDKLAEDDRTRALFIPTPIGSPFDPDYSIDIARLKGEIGAITREMIGKRCSGDYQ
jgi:hypothetical protein